MEINRQNSAPLDNYLKFEREVAFFHTQNKSNAHIIS